MSLGTYLTIIGIVGFITLIFAFFLIGHSYFRRDNILNVNLSITLCTIGFFLFITPISRYIPVTAGIYGANFAAGEKQERTISTYYVFNDFSKTFASVLPSGKGEEILRYTEEFTSTHEQYEKSENEQKRDNLYEKMVSIHAGTTTAVHEALKEKDIEISTDGSITIDGVTITGSDIKEETLKINPDGDIYMLSGMYKEAIEAYKQAIRIDPDSAKAHSNLGAAYVYLNDRDSALEQYKILKSLDSELANKLFNLIYE